MLLREPKLEFVRIDAINIVTTSGTQGGDTCIGNEPDCGNAAQAETCSVSSQTGPSFGGV